MLRLGVAKVYLIDHDVVDIHNLNRQLMYTLEDVGQSKVTAALKNAAFHNIGHTKLEGFQGDALKNWQKIVAWARDSDIVFNCIDWGDKFDSAVMSLCYRLRIPLIMGGTFAVSMSIDFFGPHGVPCYLCSDDSFSQNA